MGVNNLEDTNKLHCSQVVKYPSIQVSKMLSSQVAEILKKLQKGKTKNNQP
jgi:hypothetical protein